MYVSCRGKLYVEVMNDTSYYVTPQIYSPTSLNEDFVFRPFNLPTTIFTNLLVHQGFVLFASCFVRILQGCLTLYVIHAGFS